MPQRWRIRPVLLSDADKWQSLRCKLWPDGAEDHASEISSFFAGRLSEPLAVLFATDEAGEVAGFVELSTRNDVPGLEGKRSGYIEGLYVERAMRFCGVARALLLASRDWARSRNCVALASDRSDRFICDSRYAPRPR